MADASIRTPRGIGKTALAATHPQHLAATALKVLAERNKREPGVTRSGPRARCSSGRSSTSWSGVT